jgi:hypothetical protein
MRTESAYGLWVIWLLLVTLVANGAFAASPDFCTMSSSSRPVPASLSQNDRALPDHTATQHDAAAVQDQHGCCASDDGDADCMMSVCLSMMPPIIHATSFVHACSTTICFHAPAFPQPPYFPLLKPPIA